VRGRAPSGATPFLQQLQFLQVQGLQRHPVFSVAAAFSLVFSNAILLLPNNGLAPYGIRTMVRNQAKNSDTIGALAKAAGVGVETVRYYQRRGLLAEPAKPQGEIRRYGDDYLRRLKFIRSAQAAGFTLAEIAELLDLSASDDRARARELAQARVSALDAKILELREAREALSGLATACKNQRGGSCPILTAFDRG
jgi:MerR family transcriptional regulator, mercuric resistance operon regulatory protein